MIGANLAGKLKRDLQRLCGSVPGNATNASFQTRLKSGSLWRNKNGSAAIEFAMLILPFSLIIFAIFEIALLFFVDSSLDSALHRTARAVRIGTAQKANWDIDRFKSEVCSNMALYFNCSNSLLIVSAPVSDTNNVTYVDPVKDGALNVTEKFDPGAKNNDVLIQAFIPWSPVLPMFGFAGAKLSNGDYVLSAAVLFRNEPF
ncbi:TadE/TadG family type IV pilus assembly protein [Rhizobium sp. L1K21]|uniref:TadE/TadG family type IV pilus assembly protein n=1 Tax=Rhizobium sp. L1K21 TaxID=2954933 RepID=UPI002092470F|nr:TadE/TadG family type IV pilus assembly protein [Rhizobium sp. L1K21]MCO6186510.1 pilus assembly protein [Rhizobium sp. L1K21]